MRVFVVQTFLIQFLEDQRFRVKSCQCFHQNLAVLEIERFEFVGHLVTAMGHIFQYDHVILQAKETLWNVSLVRIVQYLREDRGVKGNLLLECAVILNKIV